MTYGDIGAVGGCDLSSRVEAMIDELMRLREANEAYEGMDTLEQAVQELIDHVLEPGLNDYAPSYCSFGKQNGEYGFWVDDDAIQMAVYDKDLLKVDDFSEVPEDYVGDVLHVSDHGNLMCGYIDESTKKFVEMWSCV